MRKAKSDSVSSRQVLSWASCSGRDTIESQQSKLQIIESVRRAEQYSQNISSKIHSPRSIPAHSLAEALS